MVTISTSPATNLGPILSTRTLGKNGKIQKIQNQGTQVCTSVIPLGHSMVMKKFFVFFKPDCSPAQWVSYHPPYLFCPVVERTGHVVNMWCGGEKSASTQ